MREEFGRGCRLLAPPKKVEHLPLGWDVSDEYGEAGEGAGRGGRVCHKGSFTVIRLVQIQKVICVLG